MKSMIKAAETAIHTYVSPDVQVAIVTESRQAARPEPGKLLPLVKMSLLFHPERRGGQVYCGGQSSCGPS